MPQAVPIAVAGRLLGAAVAQAEGVSFIATDPVVGDLHGQRFASAVEAARVATLVLRRAQTAPPTPPALRPPPQLRIIQK